MVKVKIQKIHEDAVLPEYIHLGDAGADLFSVENYIVNPGERILVNTGIKLEIPEGYEGQIRSKSGLALKHGIKVLNSPGTVDSAYRGEICVILINLGQELYKVKKGEKVAQLVINQVERAIFQESESLEATLRGEGGFGSTGLSQKA